ESAYGQGKPGLNLNNIKSVTIALPTEGEATEIVKRVEQLLALADKIERRYNKAKAQIDKFPGALLTKAFRGELVPQNLTDEPASVLLDRIKKLKEKAFAPRQKRKSKSK